MENVNWKALQNGSDIRGVALPGVSGEEVNLTPEIANLLGQAFVTWLEKKVSRNATKLIVSVGRDSRLSGLTLMESLME